MKQMYVVCRKAAGNQRPSDGPRPLSSLSYIDAIRPSRGSSKSFHAFRGAVLFSERPRRSRLLFGRFMNTNNERHGFHKYRCARTVQALIAPTTEPQHRFVAIDGIDCVAIRYPVFLIIRDQTAVSQPGWSKPSDKIANNPVRQKGHCYKRSRGAQWNTCFDEFST